MLIELSVQNLAIIHQATLRWEKGFTVISGETGSGKSILMGALKILLGERVKADKVGKWSDRARVEAIFELPDIPELKKILKENEIDFHDQELILQREITRAGRSRCRINGSIVTLNQMEKTGSLLVDLHGQHQQQSLIHPRSHLEYLDAFAGLTELKKQYFSVYQSHKQLTRQLDLLIEENEKIREQIDFIRFQFEELNKAKFKSGEEEKIESQLHAQKYLSKLVTHREEALGILQSDQSSPLDSLRALQKHLQILSEASPGNKLEHHLLQMDSVFSTLNEIEKEVLDWEIPEAIEPEKLDQLNARMAFLQRLQGKYKTDVSGLIKLKDTRQEQLSRIENAQIATSELEEKIREKQLEMTQLATQLHEKRQQAGKGFSRAVDQLLEGLGMQGSQFRVTVSPRSNEPLFISNGNDDVEFLLSANPGEPPRPLQMVASGGECSRVMLAVKTVLAQHDPRPMLVFDEIDSGIGGTTGIKVGQALHRLSQHHQVVAITHLHQVAAEADHHFLVEKSSYNNETITSITALGNQARVQELARMMGDKQSSSTLQHARELLEKTD